MATSLRAVAAGIIAFSALLTVSVSAQRPPDDPSTVRYRGRVADGSGFPLPGAVVTCTARGGVRHVAKADDKGEYVLASTSGACQFVTFELEGFVTESFRGPSAGVLDVSLNVGTLGPYEPIGVGWRGLVVNADGTPAVDASIWLWRLGTVRIDGSRTDGDGTFAMPVADFAGEFVLCARGAGEGQRATCLTFTAGEPFPGGRPRLQLPPRPK